MKEELEIIKKAARLLSEQTGLKVEYKTGKTSDYEVKINAPDKDAETEKYFAEVKTSFSNAKLGDVLIQAKRFDAPFLFVTEYVTQPQAEKMRELKMNFLDAAGNAFINAPGFFVFITGKKGSRSKQKSINIFRPAGMKMIFAFLQKDGFENADYRTIAAETGLTHTTVGRVFADLEKAGFLIRRAGDKRFLTNKVELLKRWTISYGEQFRAALKPVRYSSTKHTGRWWEKINIKEYKAFWGGETGGAILTKHLKPQNATIYADSNLPKLQAKYGLIKDEKGEMEILRRFWNFGEFGDAAPPLVVYADLLATADERNLETAQIIYDEYLAQIAEENS